MKQTNFGVRGFIGKPLAVSLAILLVLMPVAFIPATVAYAAPATIFADGFESDDFSNWTTAEAGWSVVGGGGQEGTYKARATAGPLTNVTLEKDVSTVGYENIALSFFHKDNGLEIADTISVEYTTDGVSWNPMTVFTDGNETTTYTEYTFAFPATVDDNSSFGIRFRATNDSASDQFDLDAVSITGTSIPLPTPATVSISLPITAMIGDVINFSITTIANDDVGVNAIQSLEIPSEVTSLEYNFFGTWLPLTLPLAGNPANPITDGIQEFRATFGSAGVFFIGDEYTNASTLVSVASTTESITVGSNTAPTISLIGGSPVVVNQGSVYGEPGYTASDAEDGDLTGSVVVTGTVDTGTVGSYELTYSVTDSGSLTATTTRTVEVAAVVSTGGGGGGGGGFPADPFFTATPISTPAPVGEVEGATITPEGETVGGEVLGAECNLFLTAYLRSGDTGVEVYKLQIFLNLYENANLAYTGVFDSATLTAVKVYQTKYYNDIILPWVNAGYKAFAPTGFVYLTTQNKINSTFCTGTTIPLPELVPTH